MRRTLVSGLLLAAVAGCIEVNPRPVGDDRISQLRPNTYHPGVVSGAQAPMGPGRAGIYPTTATAAGQAQMPVAFQPPASAAAPPGVTTQTANNYQGLPFGAPTATAGRPTDYFPPPEPLTPAGNSEGRSDPTGLSGTTLPALRDSATTPPPVPAGVTAAQAEVSPATVTSAPALRLVNAKRFTLNYESKDAANDAPLAVDLWCTQDLRSWKKFDAQPQGTHGCIVEVKDEGTYGFTLVARAGGAKPPASGDAPQVWVTVDTTRPVVQMTGVELSLTAKAPSLIVGWNAKDKNFGQRPVTLSYSTQPEGPWTLMAQNLENTGRYEWPMPTTLPQPLYVRVEAIDLVGNTGMAQTPTPVRFDAAWAAGSAPLPDLPKASLPARPEASIANVEVSAVPTPKQ
jgi:hypothetical protein